MNFYYRYTDYRYVKKYEYFDYYPKCINIRYFLNRFVHLNYYFIFFPYLFNVYVQIF